MSSTIERAAEQLGRAAAALGRVSGDAQSAKQLLALLGWALPPGAEDIGLTQFDVSRLAARLKELTELRSQEGSTDADLAVAVAATVDALAEALVQIEKMGASLQGGPEYLNASGLTDQLFGRVTDLLVIHAVGTTTPMAVPAGTLLGLFEFTYLPADPAIFQVEHVRQVVRWDRLATLFTAPQHLLRDVYGWGNADFRGSSLVANIGRVMEFVAADTRLRTLPRSAQERLAGRAVPEADTDPQSQVFISLDKGLGNGAFDVGLSLYPVRPSAPGGADGGIGLSPYFFGTTDTVFALSDHLSLELQASEAVQGGLALLLRAGRDPQLMTGLFDGVSAPTADVALTLRSSAPAGQRRTLLSGPGLVFDAESVSVGLGVTAGPNLDPMLSAGIEKGRIQIGTEGADSFLASILPAGGITLDMDLEAGWSRGGGVHFKGGAGLSTTLALNTQAGPLRLSSLTLALKATAQGMSASAGLSGAASLGPVKVAASGIGASAALQFKRGNLGPVDASIGFLPPSGVGLSLDANGVLTGGGFLQHDEATQTYAGAMQVSLQDRLTLSAYGLIATQLPGGQSGYSLLVFITAEGFKPVPLGLGFMLQRIGGMFGLNRAFDQEVIRAGLKTDLLASLLFPRDPVANAPALLQALAGSFPAQPGSVLVGLLARITWFTPVLVQMDLALILEVAGHTRLLMLGRVSSLLPSRDDDLLRLNLDAMGVLDFTAGTVEADAVLVDSRLAHRFPVTGSGALRARWSSSSGAPATDNAGPVGAAASESTFVLSAGGLNPHFAPPQGFPALERVAIALCSGKNPRLICEAYLAITANTLQFGSRVSLYAEAAGFSVSGDLGFDALITLLPLHFIVDFHAQVQLKRGSHNLFKVTLDGTLEGPLPLQIAAKASFEILWFSFSVHFNYTLAGGAADHRRLPAVALQAELVKALGDVTNWGTQRAPRQAQGVALRSLTPGAALVLDPLGQLVVRQQIAPLNTSREIDTFNGAPVSGPRRFHLQASLGGQAGTTVSGAFTPSRYFTMSDDEKLAAPSFETLDAGVALGMSDATFDPATIVAAPLTYESLTLNPLPAAGAAPLKTADAPRYALPVAALQAQRTGGAAAKVPVRRMGRGRFANEDAKPAATLAEPRWRIVAAGDGSLTPAAPQAAATWSQQRAELNMLNRGSARWLLAPAHEVETPAS